MRSIPNQGEKSQVPHHGLVLRGNQGVRTITCTYCQQVGDTFNHCPFVDDILR